MCWSFHFGFPAKKKPKTTSSSGEKKRRDAPADSALRRQGRPIVAQDSEKRSSNDSSRKRRSRDSTQQAPRTRRREKQSDNHTRRSQRQYEDAYRRREHYRSALNLEVPHTYRGSYAPPSVNSSQETLLNPRPHRSQPPRRRHPTQSSQGTLRGRGAKRDPPRHSKSSKNIRPEPSRGWSLFAASTRTPKRESRSYQTLDSSPRSHGSSRHHHSSTTSQTSPESSPSQNRQHGSRRQGQSTTCSRQAHSRTPNTTARRVPDRRFAVLAATNQALEEVRQEAFAQPSPPPRRARLHRYEHVTIPTWQIPFNWDCMSTSQTSSGRSHGNGESSSRPRGSRK